MAEVTSTCRQASIDATRCQLVSKSVRAAATVLNARLPPQSFAKRAWAAPFEKKAESGARRAERAESDRRERAERRRADKPAKQAC